MQKTYPIIGVKELRENLNFYIQQINEGHSFTIVKRSKPVFHITPIQEDEAWEQVADFTQIQTGGVNIQDILSRLS
ncbi:type II toxin-antitoxin system prevent-host-death family antitoxin [Patescibacteria group bacterium]|nr:type II toxin-antitoxin system prevent-host-death family antitoxin [Patescibacteria group bacterium]MBU1721863.1 type II toxin-antitoxin system prevent-host-death family antitoxin [Patescibacteria group bacterium]MBU1901321.1 type II toxin-antitoxin system prevent-host-death family antitoxin [Patescibacteria group bacterium]